MSAFTLDTSGAVRVCGPLERDHQDVQRFEWPDLSPFEQGYVEALLTGKGDGLALWTDAQHNGAWDYRAGFSDLAPETLAAIRKDCADFVRRIGKSKLTDADHRERGAFFWEARQSKFDARWSLHQAEMTKALPPLTPVLGDDGKVYLREGASA